MNDEQQRLPQDEEVSLREYLNVILRRKKTLFLTLCAVFLGAAIYTFAMKPIYEASSTLHVQGQEGRGRLLEQLTLDMRTPVDAELEIIRSRTNAEQVVRRLHLHWLVKEKTEGLDFKILEFASSAREPVYRIRLTTADTFVVEDREGKVVGKGQSDVLLQGEEITLLLDITKGNPGDSFRISRLSFYDTVNRLRRAITATEVRRNTDIIRVTYNDTDPVRARDVVNTLVQVYLEQSVSFRTQEAGRTVEFVEEQLKGLRRELDQSEKNLQAYRSATGIIRLDSEAEELIRTISETEKMRAEIILERKQLEFALDGLQEARKRGASYSPVVLRNDPLIAGLAAQLSNLEVRRRALLAEYTEAYPPVQAVIEQIDEVQRRIQAAYETSRNNIITRDKELTRQIAFHEGKMRDLPEAERELAQLTRISAVNAEIYTFLLQRHEEARIARASTISHVNIVDPAITPERPIKPRKSMNLLIGLLVGAMAGLFLAFFHDYLDDTIKDTEEAKRVTGLPLLAIIPFIPGRPENGKKNGIKDRVTVFTELEPKSHVAEAFRSLRTNLHFSAINREKKIILITSTFPGEGKTVISSNFANTLSQTGAKVLILDCDLRRSSMHTKFGHDKIPGLTELLAGDMPFTKVLRDTGIPGIDLISAGTTPPNPSELLGSEAMRRLLPLLKEKYTHIVIDAPPVLAVTDAPVLTALADIVLIVMEVGRVPEKAARRMRELLTNVRAPVAGLVMNDKNKTGGAYGYYGDSYYRDGYYSDDAPPAKENGSWVKGITGRVKKG